MTGRVVVLATGGTIASRVSTAGGDVTATATAADLLQALQSRGLTPPAGVTVDALQVCNVGSFQLDLPASLGIAKRAAEVLAAPDVQGVVVTHGTDTMEESAFLADLVVGGEKPVVFTGAQRHADEADTDGPRNLADSIRIAADPAARGLGAVICFEGEIHAARDVTKQHTSRSGTFWSGEHGKLGDVDPERVTIQRRPLLRRHLPVDSVESRVDLVRLVMGSDGRFIRHAVADGARAVVVEAYGLGNGNAAVNEAIREAVTAGVKVVVCSRCPQGRVRPVYGNGGGRDVAAAGGLFAGDLNGAKARILAAVLLGSPCPAEFDETLAALAG